MPGIEPISARHWDHDEPALGTLIFHCHVEIPVLFKRLVPTAWRWSLSWGSSVSPFPLGALSFAQTFLACCPRWWIMLRKWNWQIYPGEQAWCSEAFIRVIRHCTLDVCHTVICGLGSKLPCNWSELWGEWKRACGIAIVGSVPRSTIYEILVKPAQHSGPKFPH